MNILSRTSKDKDDYCRSLSKERYAAYKTKIEALFESEDIASIPIMQNYLDTVPMIVREVLVERGLDPYYWKSIPAHLWESK